MSEPARMGLRLKIPPPVVTLISGMAIWGCAALWPELSFTFAFQTIIVCVIAGAGVAILGTSVAAFAKAKTTVTPLEPDKASSLVVSGLYRFTRNPMYLAMLLVLTGVAIWFGNLLAIAVLVGFVAYINAFQIKPEEESLARLFGAEYEAYRRQVRRWI